jgi:hypothetical protein
MTLPYLPDDCIHYILNYLQDYHSTLFNCLLVNRFWCRAVIPLLYANPFIIINKNIILTLIPCFSQSEILQLKNQLNLIGIDNININDEYKPLFEYPKYLKIYDYYILATTIFEWFNGLANLSYNQEMIIEKFILTFNQSILYHSINIEQFEIDLNSFINSNFKLNVPTTILTKLNSLTFKLQTFEHNIEKEFLSNIANNCSNLKELKVSSMVRFGIPPKIQDVIIDKLCIIIQNQDNLEKIKISEFFMNDNVFLSLEFQKHSLVFIEFSCIDFSDISFKKFIKLYNLKHIKFVNSKDIKPNDRYEILQFASFKLKKLEFRINVWKENIGPTIIKYLGTSLQCLIINDEIITNSMIENISLYCLNLITLEIVISGFDHFDISIFPYFKNLVIRKLNITIIDSYGNDMSEMFINLAESLPINLKEVSFGLNSRSNYDQLYYKIFLENYHNHLEKINLSQSLIGSKFFKIIFNYIEKSNNGLEILNLAKIERSLNNEELKLLDEIRAKGTKIVINF